jgi:dTDP-4-dehydrorhamnose 3,5-epimerase
MNIKSVKNFHIEGPLLIESIGYRDIRGIFAELYNYRSLIEHIDEIFIQDNISFSKKNVIRGLHYQKSFPQGKLIYCLRGCIFDVALDIRLGSPTFGQYIGVTLNSKYIQGFYIPPGFAHGFAVSSKSDAIVLYKCTRVYRSDYDSAISWKSADIKLPKDFIIEKEVYSKKDLAAPALTPEMGIIL